MASVLLSIKSQVAEAKLPEFSNHQYLNILTLSSQAKMPFASLPDSVEYSRRI
jgi:hypothetical protein